MGRSIIADEGVEKYIGKLLKENKWFVGVIIGQLTAQRDYVVHIARTPDPVEDEVSEENGDDESGDSIKTKKKNPALEHPVSMDQLDEKWVSTHAKQVSRMLPGGLSVIGLFAIAPPVMLKNAQSKLKQMLHSVYKQLTRNSVLTIAGEITERILLQMDTSSKKLTCVTVDAADIKSAMRPAEWKYQTGDSKWIKLTSQINLDIPITVPVESKSQSLLKQIQLGLVEFCDTVKRSIVVIGDSIRDPSEPLIQEKRGKGGKGSNTDLKLTQDVAIYLPFLRPETSSDPVTVSSQATINMMGTTIVRAFVSAKATVGDAVEAIKMDVIRSLMARCELLCEEFNVTEGKQGSDVYDPPVRLFCQLPHCDVQVCDYVFQDEKQEEVRDRIKELLDVEVEDLEETEKSAADDDTWSCPSSLSCMSSHQSLVVPQPDKKTMAKAYLGAALVCMVAVLATWISYLYIN
ncbi:protein odr-4 homolog [Physella acuta]|uniref:protein odr-4 homolog n=1 Tax=Physella acuta TaxID=109671 RepID=UPI0027DCE11D|nr:protein odr-4 homolog [Physella acuta]